MNFEFTEQQEAIREAISRICSQFGDEYWLARDQDGQFPDEFVKAITEGGWLGIAMPESFAEMIGETIVNPSYFHSDKNLKRLKKAQSKLAKKNIIQDKIGTVGAVALDKYGNISAATSTGGMTNKMPGRVGDSPIIG